MKTEAQKSIEREEFLKWIDQQPHLEGWIEHALEIENTIKPGQKMTHGQADAVLYLYGINKRFWRYYRWLRFKQVMKLLKDWLKIKSTQS
jgi:hypothetical protein